MSSSSSSSSCAVYSADDFLGLERVGALTAHVLDYITPFIEEGISTGELDRLCQDEISKHHGISATLGYHGYPCSTCISVNHVVCHGIPSEKHKLRKGDILNIDITTILDGWYGDSSRMYIVGKASPGALRLINTAYEALMLAIDLVKPGAYLGDIGHAIQRFVESRKFAVVRDYCGHGIGRVFHDEPAVLHFGRAKTGLRLKPGHVFTIEPMINAGAYQTVVLSDGWTAVTVDSSLSAQFEHTIGVTEDGCRIFTESRCGLHKPPYKLPKKLPV